MLTIVTLRINSNRAPLSPLDDGRNILPLCWRWYVSSLVTEHGPLDADMPALAKALDIDLGTHDIALQSSAFEKTVEWKKDDLLRESRTAEVGTTEMSPQKKKPKK